MRVLDSPVITAFDYYQGGTVPLSEEMAAEWGRVKAAYAAGAFRTEEGPPDALDETMVCHAEEMFGVTDLAAAFGDLGFLAAMSRRDKAQGVAVQELLLRGRVDDAREAFRLGHELNLNDHFHWKYERLLMSEFARMASPRRPINGQYPAPIYLHRAMFRGQRLAASALRLLAAHASCRAVVRLHGCEMKDLPWWRGVGVMAGVEVQFEAVGPN